MKISRLAKYIGIPSIASIVLGAGLFLYSGNADKKYKDFIEETSQITKQVDNLEYSIKNLVESEKALTHYLSEFESSYSLGKFGRIDGQSEEYHSPDVDEALEQLTFAKSHITKREFHENEYIKNLENKIILTQRKLETTEKGKSELFYKDRRNEIKDLKLLADIELIKQIKEVPTNILTERKSLLNQTVWTNEVGLFFGISGALGAMCYALMELMGGKDL